MAIGYLHSTESFGAVDGPGLRFVFFLQGCPLRCRYCHNPDTWATVGGTPITVDEAVREVRKYKSYLGRGGVTLTGGEPLLQPDFCIELARALKSEGIHVAIDTCGYPFDPNDRECKEKFTELCTYVDLFLLDIKHIDPEVHKALTGKDNDRTLAFARFLSERGVPMWIRYVVCPTYTDSEDDARALRAFLDTLRGVEKIEVLPYHTMGAVKYEKMGIPYSLKGIEPPEKETVARIRAILQE